ncbi:Resolvase domain-containing protein [Alkalidesulfovibrio alkalitolerans DSM 16529]|uniref:Resolvase domain-containing protein n=1 Tax=Alkalidesulfovibrio alkalitolerans DSM 16529 TaxID=1121439 RepID=S7ULU0_9BACT|nr:recombinase family protein [Alkalidesulfovibrio alkalitolerans]EPR34859.1 Resolvase domain-containing protein [Alkalidesulfovibrio alkalitolerans DSM 16529]
MEAYGYLRVSGRGQIEGDGFRRQRETIEEYAVRHGMELVEFFEEAGISGTTDETERPAFKSMVSAILRNGVRVIVVEGLDRLAREYRVQEQLAIFLASKGIKLISARTEEDVTAAIMGDPMKKALVQVQGVFAELERSLLVKKLRSAREAVRDREGKCEGRKSLAEVAPEVLGTIKRLRRKRPKQGRRTYKEIAAILNEQGVTTTSGKAWSSENVRKVCERMG